MIELLISPQEAQEHVMFACDRDRVRQPHTYSMNYSRHGAEHFQATVQLISLFDCPINFAALYIAVKKSYDRWGSYRDDLALERLGGALYSADERQRTRGGTILQALDFEFAAAWKYGDISSDGRRLWAVTGSGICQGTVRLNEQDGNVTSNLSLVQRAIDVQLHDLDHITPMQGMETRQ
jgi:hypothetical protein